MLAIAVIAIVVMIGLAVVSDLRDRRGRRGMRRSGDITRDLRERRRDARAQRTIHYRKTGDG